MTAQHLIYFSPVTNIPKREIGFYVLFFGNWKAIESRVLVMAIGLFIYLHWLSTYQETGFGLHALSGYVILFNSPIFLLMSSFTNPMLWINEWRLKSSYSK